MSSPHTPRDEFDDVDPCDATTVRLPVLKEPFEVVREAPNNQHRKPDGSIAEDRRKR